MGRRSATRRPRALVVSLSIGQVLSWGVLYYSFGAFILPMQRDLGASRFEIAGAMSAAWGAAALASVPIGRWIDRNGGRRLMLLGSFCAPLLVAAWSRVDSVVALYAVWTAIGIAMATTLYEPAFAVLVRARQARSIGIVGLAGGIAGTIFAPSSSLLIDAFGWRQALVALAALLALAAPLLQMHLPRNSAPYEATRASRADERACASSSLPLLTVGVALASSASVVLSVHIIPLLVDAGHDPRFAATVLGIMSLALLPGRGAYIALQRIWSSGPLLLAAVTISAGVMPLLLLSGRTDGAIAFAVIFGLTNSFKTPALATAMAERFETSYGRATGASALAIRLSQAAGPTVAAWTRTVSGSYDVVVVAIALALGLSAGAIRAALR